MSSQSTRAQMAAILAFASRRRASGLGPPHGTAAALKAMTPDTRDAKRAARKVRNARKARRGYA